MTVLFCLTAGFFTVLGFWMDTSTGLLVLGTCGCLGTILFFFTKGRYKKIAQLSEQIDQVLHYEDHLILEEETEGELSVLQSEICKMTLRIREQNDLLKKEKKYLADSLADIAHQLRTPLTSMNLILSLLENHPDEQERRRLICENKELLSQIDWLLSSLLKLSRLDAGVAVFQKERLEVRELLSDASRHLLIPLELHDITLQIDVPQGIMIEGDAGWFAEAVTNILKNCMESVGEHGKIRISCEDNQLFTKIIIRDSGSGFDQEELPFLFERFYRGKNASATGYGIGMALCRRIIVQQGGTVTAGNHPEGGAVFSIRFPK